MLKTETKQKEKKKKTWGQILNVLKKGKIWKCHFKTGDVERWETNKLAATINPQYLKFRKRNNWVM